MSYEKRNSYKKFIGKGKTTLNREPLTLNQGQRKRGKLAPLMSEEAKTTASIHELSYDFGCRITRLFQYLTEDAEYKEFVQSKQLYRSGTSVGANVRESKHAQSDADFLSKMSIAYKEADESDYWLNLLHDNGYLDDKQFDSLSKDCTRILKILTSIVKTLNQKVKGRKGNHEQLTFNHNCGGQPENLLDFVNILQEELVRAGVLPKDYDFDSHKELVPMQPGDVPVTYADSTALERDFGFTPKITLREGLRKFATWYKEYYG